VPFPKEQPQNFKLGVANSKDFQIHQKI